MRITSDEMMLGNCVKVLVIKRLRVLLRKRSHSIVIYHKIYLKFFLLSVRSGSNGQPRTALITLRLYRSTVVQSRQRVFQGLRFWCGF